MCSEQSFSIMGDFASHGILEPVRSLCPNARGWLYGHLVGRGQGSCSASYNVQRTAHAEESSEPK